MKLTKISISLLFFTLPEQLFVVDIVELTQEEIKKLEQEEKQKKEEIKRTYQQVQPQSKPLTKEQQKPQPVPIEQPKETVINVPLQQNNLPDLTEYNIEIPAEAKEIANAKTFTDLQTSLNKFIVLQQVSKIKRAAAKAMHHSVTVLKNGKRYLSNITIPKIVIAKTNNLYVSEKDAEKLLKQILEIPGVNPDYRAPAPTRQRIAQMQRYISYYFRKDASDYQPSYIEFNDFRGDLLTVAIRFYNLGAVKVLLPYGDARVTAGWFWWKKPMMTYVKLPVNYRVAAVNYYHVNVAEKLWFKHYNELEQAENPQKGWFSKAPAKISEAELNSLKDKERVSREIFIHVNKVNKKLRLAETSTTTGIYRVGSSESSESQTPVIESTQTSISEEVPSEAITETSSQTEMPSEVIETSVNEVSTETDDETDNESEAG